MNTLSQSFKKVYVFLFARKAFYSLHLLGYKLSMLGMGIQNYENDRVSGEKAFIKYLIARNKLQSGVIFDIGANVGHYSIMLRKHGITLPIFAFEPHPGTFRRLVSIADAYQITPVSKGAGETTGHAAIYDYSGQNGSEHASMYRDVITQLRKSEVEEISIDLTSIDEFAAANQVSKIALLKIDTEGHELQVLKGARRCIEKGMVDVIQMEFNEMNIISKTFFKDIVDLLPGYDFYRLLPDGLKALGKYHPIHYEIFSFQNIVAMRRLS
ncbi:FkbM family methyltransferase [Chitinophaga eiseniae]|uniref:FkbM family methyltransferase n=1 Tax=Chitinophaga eiseniae TaxID=634771 RepID=A0A847SCQ5_9BACT|nr:FkbM family methyltransferase [Chitinophaga eiseniae]NLR80990.1 FkbM family methyltransferase [Chitinophaga eiseniae]